MKNKKHQKHPPKKNHTQKRKSLTRNKCTALRYLFSCQIPLKYTHLPIYPSHLPYLFSRHVDGRMEWNVWMNQISSRVEWINDLSWICIWTRHVDGRKEWNVWMDPISLRVEWINDLSCICIWRVTVSVDEVLLCTTSR